MNMKKILFFCSIDYLYKEMQGKHLLRMKFP